MSDLLNVSVSGLRAFQRALETTSHNIANVATPGYSRQTVMLSTREPSVFGTAAIGTGVQVQGIRRYSNDLLLAQMRSASSGQARLEVYSQNAGALSNLFADGNSGLSSVLQRFSNALQEVANTPTSTAARQVLLSEAGGLVTRLEGYEARLDSLEAQINDQLRSEVVTINSIAANISRLNLEIARVSGQTSAEPADLMDARDQQLAELAKRLDTVTVTQDGGIMNVFVGNGQPLVLGGDTAQLVAQSDPFMPGRIALALSTPSGAVDVTASLKGGSIGGLLDARRELLDPARNELGRIAVGLVEAVNTQHHKGIDLQGVAGGDFFAVGGVEAFAARTNNGTAVLNATRTSAGGITTHDYLVTYDGSAWRVQRADTGAPVTYTGTTTLDFDGISVSVGGTAVAGDRFLVRPAAGAIKGLGVLISDPARVAAAAPIRTATGTANTGNGVISAGEVLDADNAALRDGVTIQFTAPGTWEARGAGNVLLASGSYSSGGNIDVNGWRVNITGTPAAGDSFTVSSNTSGVGDNRNALALAGVMQKGVLAGGTESLDGAVGRFVGAVGVASLMTPPM